MTRVAASLALLLALAGCGGGGDEDAAEPPPQRTAQERPPAAEDPLALPRAVPRAGTGVPPAAARRVIRDWLAAVRASDFDRAARLFAVPARVQNASPVIELDSRELVAGWNASLPCGAVLTSAKAAPRGFVIATFRLTDRRGSRCDPGRGSSAASAIRIERGRISEWYRLDDAGAPQPDAEPETPGPLV